MCECFVYVLIAVTFYYGIVLLIEDGSNPGDIVMLSYIASTSIHLLS